MELYTDKELIEDYLKNKSQKSARQLVEKYRQFVFSIAYRYTRDYDEAEDLSQEAFIKAFANLKTFEFKSSLKTWLYVIVKNVFLNSGQKRNIETQMQKTDIGLTEDELIHNINPENEYEYNELMIRFEKTLQKLPERQREVFSLRYFDDMKYEEISELLGLTIGGLKANYYHAIKKITEELKNE